MFPKFYQTNKKPKTKRQSSPIDLAEKRAWTWFSKYIRLRDCIRTTGRKDMFKCISCGAITAFGSGDAGHFISRSYKATKFDERNVFGQCAKCNRFLQGQWDKMYEAIRDLHGQETIDDLMIQRNKLTYNVDYAELADKYRNLYNSLK